MHLDYWLYIFNQLPDVMHMIIILYAFYALILEYLGNIIFGD